MRTVYVCSPHWLEERNREIAEALVRRGIAVTLPQELGKDATERKDQVALRAQCIAAIDNADCVVVHLDNYGMDSAWELGYAEKAGKEIIGITFDAVALNTPSSRSPKSIWDHWMHGWSKHLVVRHSSDLREVAQSRKVYLSLPVDEEGAVSLIERELRPLADRLITPRDLIVDDLRKQPKERWVLARSKCLTEIDQSDTFIMLLDGYGMDSAWELGYAEGSGLKIVGFSLSPDRLRKPVPRIPQTIWDYWMHGWKMKTIVRGVDQLAKLVESDEQFRIPVVCPIIERSHGGVIQVLVQTRSNSDDQATFGLIEVPGGKIRRYELIADAVKREVNEECGLEVEPLLPWIGVRYAMPHAESMLSNVFAVAEEFGGKFYLGLFVTCKVVGGELRETSEGRSPRWVDLDTLRRLLANKRMLPINAPGLLRYLSQADAEREPAHQHRRGR